MQPTVPFLMGTIMSKEKLDLNAILMLVEILDCNPHNCQKLITILEDIFANEKSSRILIATEVYEYCIKNCNRRLHHSANTAAFQKSLLKLLKRVRVQVTQPRGKMGFLKEMTSNSDNWTKIELKVLYLVQLCYDAFILEENNFKHTVATYKILRKENIMFPPRLPNQRNLLTIKSESPIFENIHEIARSQQAKFIKKLNGMGLNSLADKMTAVEVEQQEPAQRDNKVKEVNIDEISERIAIIQSNSFEGSDMLKVIEGIKHDIQYGVVKEGQAFYWQEIKQVANSLIAQWEQQNQQAVKLEAERYLAQKMGKPLLKTQSSPTEEDQFGDFACTPAEPAPREDNLLDL